MSASPLTPVTLLTGFLGSGKTTLLNCMLQEPVWQDTAVLINEFGQVPIDHLLVRQSSENIAVLKNGCICCSVAGEMVGALRDLYFKRAAGDVPMFRRVIIETTGLADPAPIMHTLLEMPLIAARYALSGVITTVDAEWSEATLGSEWKATKQIAVADRIVITKSDRVNAIAIDVLKEQIYRLNPGAYVSLSTQGITDHASLQETGLYSTTTKSPDVQRWLNAAAYRPINAPESSAAQPHDARIQAFCLKFEQPIQWDAFYDAITLLTTLLGPCLLRMKGIVHCTDQRVVAVHAVQHVFYPSATLPPSPNIPHETVLVFITRDADESRIRETLQTSIGQSAKSPPTVVSPPTTSGLLNALRDMHSYQSVLHSTI